MRTPTLCLVPRSDMQTHALVVPTTLCHRSCCTAWWRRRFRCLRFFLRFRTWAPRRWASDASANS